jgi:uncharacterized protein YecT (DUF1311 family)
MNHALQRHTLVGACLSLGLAAPIAAPAQGQEPACDPAGTQLEMNQCASDDLRKADDELNAVYRQVLASMKGQPVAQQRLRAAQRLWVQLRDADLAARFPLAEGQNPYVEYGSIYPLEYAMAKAEITRQRTDYLRRQFLASGNEH